MNDFGFASLERKNVLFLLVIGVFLLYTFRLYQMQIVRHSEYDGRSTSNSVKPIQEMPLRGVFYDRNLQLLVENTPAYTVRLMPSEYDTTNNIYLEKALGMEKGTLRQILYRNKSFSKFVPIKLKRGVDFASIGWLSENLEHLPGVDYIIELQRGYPAGITGSHIFGYSREISPEMLKRDDFYEPGDVTGFAGVERKYEKMLRGFKGYDFVIVDSRRREIEQFKDKLKSIPSIKGKDLVLTIDSRVQKVAEASLEGKSGAVVAIEPSTGEVLGMASSPDYDLNQFSYITSRDYLNQLSTDPLTPMFNRATMSMYPPGSTFKILAAIAALDMGVIDEHSTISCGGGFSFGKFFKCHGAHGAVNVERAIEVSCNTFFYKLIFEIGLNNLHDYAKRFGFGRKTGIDLLEEAGGLIPTEEYYERQYKSKNWPRGILVSLGIGQGEISVTPLQLAHFVSLVANNGKSFIPHLVKGYLDENKHFVPFTFPAEDVKVKQEVFDIVKRGMFNVVQGGGGTARGIKIPEIPIAGKTGTAQNPHGNDHALFICFAPFENPKIAVAVMVENVGFGATHAAPIAKKVIEAYLKREVSLDEIMGNSITIPITDVSDSVFVGEEIAD